LGALLYALEVPPYGGDTLFSNQYLAYETLSSGMKKLLDGIEAVHSSELVYGSKQALFDIKDDHIAIDREAAKRQIAVHPLIRTHPKTKRKSLFVNDHYTVRLKDMSDEESKPILGFLFQHAIRPEFTCRFRWSPGSIAFWDNRCTLHCPVAD